MPLKYLPMLELQKTWDDAAQQWLQETTHKRTHDDDKAKLRWIAEHWCGRNLAEVDRETVKALGAKKLEQASAATANRYLALIRAILRRAANEWEWIEKAPFVRLYSEPGRRVRWLTPEQARTLMAELPEHQVYPVVFALATGLRHGNVVGLRWDQIDLKRRVAWLFADQVKNGEDLHVSLNDVAMSVLHARKLVKNEWVFTYKGKPIQRLTTRAWYKALARAGIENFRWHDLRHTWASWQVQRGTPLYAVQEMGGWKSAAMVRRYAHLAPAVNLKYAQAIDADLTYVLGDDNGNTVGNTV